MMMGTQLVAPNGHKSLNMGVTYHFLSNSAANPQVYLAWFWKGPNDHPDSAIIGMPRSEFEEGLLSGGIVVATQPRTRPFWFTHDLSYGELMAVDALRSKSKKTLTERVEERFSAIAPLLEREQEILRSDTANKIINRMARELGKNETRMRLWFIAYLAFGREPWALCPNYSNIGRHSRAHQTRKAGRSSLSRGKGSGWPVDEAMAKAIEDSYVTYRGPAVTLASIYSKAMNHVFGCKVSTDGRLAKRYFHPAGKPFPSYGQYRYHVRKAFGQDQVQRSVYGDVRTRNRLRAPEGRFSQAVANVMEKLEADGRYTKDYPTSPHCKTLLPPLCVVAIVDVASSCTVGVGFSLNSETSEAYRMALFSMAIPKKRFAELFGLTLFDGAWECEGLPSFLIADNGPGKKLLAVEFDQTSIPMRECTPSWFAQSKATVESSNPRKIKVEGQPAYVQSDLSPVRMAVREILRVVRDNHKRDVSAKLTPDMIAAGVLPTSAGIWSYLSARGRTDANPISFDRAVRSFLSPTTFTLRSDGAYLLHRCFNSQALRETGIFESLANGQTINVRGYVLDMCVRHVWLDIRGRIIQVDAVFAIRDQDYLLSFAELQDLAAQQAISESQLREHINAIDSEVRQLFEQTTGMDWDAGKRKAGHPSPRSKASKQASTEAALGTAHRSAR
ncbi:hypothetical protein ACS15_4739 [Ralstonia insidiosa]|uniref:Transposase n=2 Tax=Burkholderiaceae TaxID=119060 RepID=A0AAC9BLD5_9RALS|nr:hypothetical protein ACS15_4739 [Ralstonia insidiosa]EPX98592.1 hypothetical protein C404_06735 [Ralstonia sp. AU12-08]